MRNRTFTWAVALCACGPASASMAGVIGGGGAVWPQLRMLPTVQEAQRTFASDVSYDGSVIVGSAEYRPNSFDTHYVPLRWGTGASAVPDRLSIPAGTFGARPTAVSANGQVISGLTFTSQSSGSRGAFWATPGSEVIRGGPFGSPLPAGHNRFDGISADGSVVVGYGFSGAAVANQGFRWTAAGGFQTLTGVEVMVNATNHDGSVSVGRSNERAVVWGPGGGGVPVELPGIGSARTWAANSITPDASVIVGTAQVAAVGSTRGYDTAVKWVGGAAVNLGLPIGGRHSMATDCSDDGEVIIGSATMLDGSTRSVVWIGDSGALDLFDSLAEWGVDTTGWTDVTATAVSGDGTTIVGSGAFNNIPQGWIATIPSPGLGTTAMLGIGTVALTRRRRYNTPV